MLWVKDTDTNPLNAHTVYAMELPFAACGPVPPPPTSAANLCDLDLDTDGDGLAGLLGGRHVVGRWPAGDRPRRRLSRGAGGDINKPLHAVRGRERNSRIRTALGSAPTRSRGTSSSRSTTWSSTGPDADAVGDVVIAFAGAPAFGPLSGKCDGAGCTAGIRLHVQVDEPGPARRPIPLCSPARGRKGRATPTSTRPRVESLGPRLTERASDADMLNAKRLAFHYGLFVHNQSPTPPSTSNSSSGCAELFGNDFMVAMGSWTPPNPAITGHTGGVGSRSEQAGHLYARARA